MLGPGGHETRACGSRCRACAALRAAAPLAVAQQGIEHVTLEDLAQAARIRASDAHVHAHGDVTGVLGAAYLESAGALQRGFIWSWRCAPTPRDGLRSAVAWLLTTLAEDPIRALFCYVEIVKGGRPLVRLREQVRQGSVAIWTAQYREMVPDSWLPPSHFELVNSATISLIATRAAQGRTHELRAMSDAVLALIEPDEALSVSGLSLVS
ncbi:hypothetical protein [Baekduia sp.]|uniref:hypothetical protein n=1 Tax=Baekduia sp. TaxID=2600305 RepID=UPI002DFE44E9|nr:hypothetical protein [Baekduia sp.]